MSDIKVNELPTDRLPVIRVVAMPKDTNPGGSIFGGWLMSQIDIAAAIPALERARCRVATVAVNSMEFHEPVFVGDVISCYAEIVKTGRTSITVKVDVYSERNPADKKIVKVTQAELTYVALDENKTSTGNRRMMSSPILEINNLTTSFGETKVVDDVSFKIERGETFVLLGESGSGKSITSLSVMRLLPTTARIKSGEVLLAGQDLLKLSENNMRDIRGDRIGMIFQEPQTSLNPNCGSTNKRNLNAT